MLFLFFKYYYSSPWFPSKISWSKFVGVVGQNLFSSYVRENTSMNWINILRARKVNILMEQVIVFSSTKHENRLLFVWSTNFIKINSVLVLTNFLFIM